MKKAIKKKTFKERCEEASEKSGVDVEFYQDEDKSSRVYEDDGYLHVACRGVRACFGVCLNDDPVIQNERTIRVLNALGMEDKISLVLVDEQSDDDGDVCPHCGRGSQYD